MGIVMTGTALGGFTFSVLVSKLLNTSLGFAWTVRVSAFICLGCIIMGNLLLSEPKKVEPTGAVVASTITGQQMKEPLSDSPEMNGESKERVASEEEDAGSGTTEEGKPRTIRQLLQDPAYLAIISSGFVTGLGLYFPMFAIQSFALENGISHDIADWLLSIINLCSVLGRTIPNWLADRYGTLELYIPCAAAAGGLIISLGGATSPGAIIAFSVLYGFFSGGIVSLYFPAVYALDPHVTTTGARLGIACMPVAFASLVGTPIAQALVGGDGNWWHGVAFAGATEFTSAALLAFAWITERRRKRR